MWPYALQLHQFSLPKVQNEKQRSMAISGSWLRGGADSDYDPVLSLMRDHLDTEGSIDICPFRSSASEIDMITGLSKMMLKRLSKGWPTMDIEQRSSAISDWFCQH